MKLALKFIIFVTVLSSVYAGEGTNDSDTSDNGNSSTVALENTGENTARIASSSVFQACPRGYMMNRSGRCLKIARSKDLSSTQSQRN
jgi:hypothetical protein